MSRETGRGSTSLLQQVLRLKMVHESGRYSSEKITHAALDGSSSSEDGSLQEVVTVKSEGSGGVEVWGGGVESSPRSIGGKGWPLVLALLVLLRR